MGIEPTASPKGPPTVLKTVRPTRTHAPPLVSYYTASSRRQGQAGAGRVRTPAPLVQRRCDHGRRGRAPPGRAYSTVTGLGLVGKAFERMGCVPSPRRRPSSLDASHLLGASP